MDKRNVRKLKRKSRKLRRRGFLVLTAAMILCFVSLAAAAPRGNGGEVYYESVEIGYGDTLWSIAAEYAENGETTEHKVREILKFNGMKTENIRSGEKILVPVRE